MTLANPLKLMSILLIAFSVFFAHGAEDKKLAADFTLKSNKDENLRLEEMRGNIVLINFWASWCGPCRKEMPILEEISKKYEDLGVTVLGINVEEDSSPAKRILAELSITFPILFDSENVVSERYNVDAMPMTVVVDRQGYQRFLHRGYKSGDEVKYQNVIKGLLRE